ncbi:MAG: DNA-binding protein [Microbacteriaceae bacterium]|jgi:spoIIIJ-associated protein|nr:DNA-binding protein [Microbacteriaceae bacterium]MCI1207444.1 DNA-binding protein [Microbacteriaceae bacterium]
MSAEDEQEKLPSTAETADEQNTPDEGEIAADYLEELLDITDLDGDIDIEEHDDRTYISIASDEEDSRLGTLSGYETVQALQDLTRLAVQARLGERSRLVLDVQGSREKRREELQHRVEGALHRLEEGEEFVDFEPMSSYERKIVHDLARENDLDSTSEGEGRGRHIVLSLPEDDEDDRASETGPSDGESTQNGNEAAAE